ncbi:MAG: InlB B-repeat-containing protein [Clostridia bacterium]|nr:InlB B-repeat-containing protein [Clostridia bacterium]
MKKLKSILAIVVVLSLLLSIYMPSVSAAETKEFYNNFVILGDSLCAGYNSGISSLVSPETFDIESNSKGLNWPHAYPFVFGKKIGLDVDFTDDQHIDVANFGICAAWSTDIYKIISDPFYIYSSSSKNYTAKSTFTLPDDYTGTRRKVDASVEGYNIVNPATWVYLDGNDTEEYSLPAGTVIPVAYTTKGSTSLTLHPIIAEKYYFTARSSYDEDGNLLDTNDDGVINDDDYIYYPGHLNDRTAVCDATPEQIAAAGVAVPSPKFTKYFYKMITDKIAQGDLNAIAIGGNDIFQTFMPYQLQTGTNIGDLLGIISIALMLDISTEFIEPIVHSFEGRLFSSQSGSSSQAGNGNGDDSNGAETESDRLINREDIIAILKHYSAESINKYFAETIVQYRETMEKIIQRVSELKPANGELVLIGHFNPFGIENYLHMMASKLQDGSLAQGVSEDMKLVITLLKAIYGSPEDYQQNLSDNQILHRQNVTAAELSDLLTELQTKTNLSEDEIKKILNDTTYPLAVLLMGPGMKDLYKDLNNVVAELAEKYNIVWTDISDTPTSGVYDPHPLEPGHNYIAERLYETTVPAIYAYISPQSTGKGTITNKGETRMRLRTTKEYKFTPAAGDYISAVYVDGKLLPRNLYPQVYSSGTYVFEKVMKPHSIVVQFDHDPFPGNKYNVDVLGSNQPNDMGAGMYQAGAKVTVKAGEKDGYEFVQWLANGVKLTPAQAFKPTVSFLMPPRDVILTAVWRPIHENQSENDSNCVLSFDTNDGTCFDDLSLPEGFVLNLSFFHPTKAGYTFDGWFYDSNLTVPVEDDLIVLDGNTTVYAKWIPIPEPIEIPEETPKTETPVRPISPKTGISRLVNVWKAIAIISSITLLAVIGISKKKKDNA